MHEHGGHVDSWSVDSLFAVAKSWEHFYHKSQSTRSIGLWRYLVNVRGRRDIYEEVQFQNDSLIENLRYCGSSPKV